MIPELEEYGLLDDNAAWSVVRSARKVKLSACDWTQVNDAPLSDADRARWAEYRQRLRDITAAFGRPEDVVWPDLPS
jgi:hypothetical protein